MKSALNVIVVDDEEVGNRCCLLPPFHQRTEQLLISRTYMKALQLRFNFI